MWFDPSPYTDEGDSEDEDSSSDEGLEDDGLYFDSDVEDPFSDSESEDEDENATIAGANVNGLQESSSQDIGVVSAMPETLRERVTFSENFMATPPAKRQRIITAGAVTHDANQSTGLQIFMTMPLDVQLEILSNLPPQDILRVARTNKTLRQVLMTRKVVGIWKAALENAQVPRCPPWMSEPAWVDLLFGDLCECCGSRRDSGFYVDLFKRLCSECLQQNFWTKKQLRSSYPSLDERTFDLVPVVELEGYFTCDYLWEPDVEQLDKQQRNLRRNIDKGIAGAKPALDKFRTQQLVKCAYIKEHRYELEIWRAGYVEERKEILRLRRSRRQADIKAQLLALGYCEEDIPLDHTDADKSKDLTPREWKRLQPLFVRMTESNRAERLENEACKLRLGRLLLLEERYLAFKKTQHPSKWKSLIPSRFLFVLEPFMSLLTADLDSPLSGEMVDGLFQEISVISSRRERQLMLCLWPLVQSSKTPTPSFSDSRDISTIDRLPMTLATAVFKSKCSGNDFYVFGLDEALLHYHGTGIVPDGLPAESSSAESYCQLKRQDLEQCQFEYAPKAARVVEELVKLLSLKLNAATPMDIDRCIDDACTQGGSSRFACGGCGTSKGRTKNFRVGYDWRNLAAHFDQAKDGHELSIMELEPHQSMAVIACEKGTVSSIANWACMHCDLHAAISDVRSRVEEHLHTVHSILRPVENQDLVTTFVSEICGKQVGRFLLKAKAPTAVSKNDPSKSKRCLHCVEAPAKSRLFIDSGVKSHLLTKHKIARPVLKIDYEHVVVEEIPCPA